MIVECLMWKEKNFMKTTKQNKMNHWTLIVGLFLLLSAVQVQAVEYKNTYGGNYRPVRSSYQTTVPSVSFQSTSMYSDQWGTAGVSMLNADGSVNTEAYMGGTGPAKVGPRRDPAAPNPEEDEKNDEGNVPIGDGLWVLMVLAVGYLIIRAHRRVLKGPRSLGT